MRPLLRSLLLLAAAAACAEEGPADWIRRLGDDDAAVRDAAQRRLLEAGADVLPAVREALKTAEDPEVQRRLQTIRATLELEDRMAELPEEWRDEWFAVTSGDAPCGWAHIATRASAENGRAIWIVEAELQLRHQKSAVESWEVTARCRRDTALSLIGAEVRHQRKEARAEWTLRRAGERLALEPTRFDGVPADAAAQWLRSARRDLELPAPPLLALVELKQVERLARAGVESQTFLAVSLVAERPPVTVDLARNLHAAADPPLVRFSATTADGDDHGSYDVDPDKGLQAAILPSLPADPPLRLRRCTEREARAE